MAENISKADPQQKRTEADRIQAAWADSDYQLTVAEVRSAALLAQEGHLTKVRCMIIRNMDISDIPSENMGKLA